MADEITGAGLTAPNEVDEPIINSPFAEPALHWQIEKGQPPVKVPGRRPASYYYRVPDSAARGRKAKAQRSLLGETNVGEREDLDLVNWLRERIKDWRAAGWPGTSPVTRELLRLWWAGSDQRKQRLFFAQIEAAETMIFLVEGADADKKGMPPIPRDEPGVEGKAAGLRAFTRYACKLHPVPPVFIVVCRDTKIAGVVYDWLALGKGAAAAPQWFKNEPGQEVAVRIDSKVVEDMEQGGTKDETRRLRFILDTVGKKSWPGRKVPEDWAELVRKNNEKAANDETDADGNAYRWIDERIPPGRDIRCIVSVAMLSEGWDANTVTHIVGLRPFGSQLLCEQVIGRALRRLSYALDEQTDRFAEENAKVFGVPFELVPFKVSKSREVIDKPDPNHIFSVPEKADFEIEFPLVEGYFSWERPDFEVDWSAVPTLTMDPMEIPNQVQLNSLTAPEGSLAAYGPGEKPLMTLADWRARFREQQVAFRLAREVTRRWEEVQAGQEQAAATPAQTLFPHAVHAARRFLADRDKLLCKGNSEPVDVLLVGKYAQTVVDSLFDALRRGSRPGEAAELPRIPNGAAGRGSTYFVDFHTTKQTCPADKCHLNAMVADTKKWEQSAGFVLDTHPSIERWVKNEHLGLRIPYRKGGVQASYIPDFIAVLLSGLRLLIEVKGQYGDDADLKAKAAERWTAAVTRHGEFGTWRYIVVEDPPALAKLLNRLASAAQPSLSLN